MEDDTQKAVLQPSIANDARRTRWATLTGTSAFTLGILLLLLRNWIPEYMLRTQLVIRPDTYVARSWQKMPLRIPTDVYFFNWTNPEDFDDIEIKPQFEQVGPYRFLQNMEKKHVVWNDNDTVTFRQLRYWDFDGGYTKGKLSDKITTMNAITMSASHHIRNWNYVIKRAASVLLATIAPKVHITRTVNQFLFDGYDDIVIDIAYYLPFLASEVPRFDRFGWFRLMNGSDQFEGVYNMENGANGNYQIRQWNYNNVTPYFGGTCASVRGAGGEFYPPHAKKDYLELFLSHLCRYLRFDFEEEVVINGIVGYKYSIGDGVLDNGTRVPGNECFCAGNCLPSGMINISSCRYGTPTYASLPHFYGADPVYLSEVNGLDPQKAKHETYVVLEPMSGLLLKAAVRLQLNILVHPVNDITIFQDVRTMFFPLLWVEQNVSLPSNVEFLLKIVLMAPYIITGVAILLIGLGLYKLLFIVFKPMITSVYVNICRRLGCKLSKQDQPYFLKEIEK